MFTAKIIFISITLLMLVGVSFWLKVPKASVPLFIIYLFFLIQNLPFNKTEKSYAEPVDIIIPKEKGNLKNEVVFDKKLTRNDTKKLIEPKPLTFDLKPQKTDINGMIKNEVKSKNSIKKNLNEEKNISLTVKDIKICKSIYKRTPVGSDVVFTNNVDSLYCYTRIQNPGPKREVKHIWYYDDQMMTQVIYNVKKSNIYRSWTKKTILPSQIGNWRVDIQDNNGTVIGSKKFEIKNISDYN
tara:strand:+ start:1150 stop:1872 length:723 start_codon:yes stop_codon:yes gene_type:complete